MTTGIQHLPDDDYKTFSSGIQHLPDEDNGIQHLPDDDYKIYGIQHLPDDYYKTFSSGIQHLPDNAYKNLQQRDTEHPGQSEEDWAKRDARIKAVVGLDMWMEPLDADVVADGVPAVPVCSIISQHWLSEWDLTFWWSSRSRLRQGYRLRFSSQSPRISHLCLWVHLSLSPTGAPYSFRYLKSTIVRAEAVDTGTHRDPRKVATREVVALVVALVAARLVAPETLTVLREKRLFAETRMMKRNQAK
ncbi:hypothetical protein DYB25_010885 [Aphanomyces astaci]|uniref:Uncharacterized protein n=1 Tax=Aphanomyces astaci TaxID=112090 RepID=A0A397ACC6_APHAT|nr:hypothetical protein DYB25_010885 [Aphanomyces astaci]